MWHIGNVLTNEKIEDASLYNVTRDRAKLLPNLVTMIVGWDTVKKLYPSASILNWQIDGNTYWTYGKRVKREKNEKDFQKFKKIALNNAAKGVQYVFFSVLTATTEEKYIFFNKIKAEDKKYMLVSGNFVYLYIPEEKTCYGISLNDVDYEGGDKKKLLGVLFNNKSIVSVKENDFLSYSLRELTKNKKYIIPYLSSVYGA